MEAMSRLCGGLPESTDLKAGEGERRVPVRLDLGVDVAAHVQQQLDGRWKVEQNKDAGQKRKATVGGSVHDLRYRWDEHQVIDENDRHNFSS